MKCSFATFAILACTSLVQFAGHALADDAPASHHRLLTVRTPATDAPGEGVSVADFYVDASHKADGSDLRVASAQGTPVPMQVLQVSGQDDRVRIAFASHGEAGGSYIVSWGDKPEKPAPPLEIKRGIFAEVFHLPNNPAPRSPELIDQDFARAGPRITATFVNDLSLGFIPAGPQQDVMVRYSAPLKVDKAGDYEISLAVSKAGYVAIDGKPLISELGGRMVRDARNAKTISLTAGWHTVTATQISRAGGETGIEVAWRKVGDPKFVTIPAGVNAAVGHAVEGAMESSRGNVEADFDIEPAAESFMPPESFCPRYSFEARPPSGLGNDRLTISWEFGDGQTSNLRKANHIFLTPGIFPVTLNIQSGGNSYRATRRIFITERLFDLFPLPPDDGAKVTTGILDSYDPAKLNATASLRGMMFFQKYDREPELLAWGKAWLAKKDGQDGNMVNDMVIDLANRWLAKGESDQAALAMEQASEKDIGLEHRAQLMQRAVILYADEAAKPDKAAALANAWSDRLNTPARQTILAAQVYAAIAKGDGKRALELAGQTKHDETHSKRQINQGVMTRNVESYIRTKDSDESLRILNEWEAEYPEAIVEGYSRLLRVKLLLAQNKPQTAARIAMDHARAIPDGFYAAELLYRAADAFRTANRPADEKTALDLLKSKYPESPYANGQTIK